MTRIAYCTSEDVRASLEVNNTFRSNKLIATKIGAAAQSVDDQTHRRFYPEIKTVTFDYPNYSYSPTNVLWLNDNEFISLTTLVIGGETINPTQYFLSRSDGKAEPPYTQIQLRLDGTATFGGGTTSQQNISVLGVAGYQDNNKNIAELITAINTTETTVDLRPLNQEFDIGVGSLIRIGDERMIVQSRRLIDTTQNLQTSMTAAVNNKTVAVTDGTAFAVDEVILLDAERMRIIDIAGNNLLVDRAFDGTSLAVHTSPVDIYSPRRFTVERAVLGTTAASHSANATVSRFVFPALITELANAEATVMLEQSASAYARVVGSGEAQREAQALGLNDLRQQVYVAHGRKARLRAI